MSMKTVAIIGGGPAGLMAAEVLSAHGIGVTIFEAMPTVGRKFLLAGKSGLNLTHSEPHEKLLHRFGNANAFLHNTLDQFTAKDIVDWAGSLGVETFTGTSGRIFPKAMKASPLLRALLARLNKQGVDVRVRHRFIGYREKCAILDTPDGLIEFPCDALLLALGGASWPKLGSNAAWVSLLDEQGVDIAQFRPANCGFDVRWSETFLQRFSGTPVKAVTATSNGVTIQGEFVISQHGVEGGLIYAHASALRDQLERNGTADLLLDLAPGRDVERLARDIGRQKQKDSFSTRLRKGAGLEGVKAALLRECMPGVNRLAPAALAATIKALPLPLIKPRPIEEAISSAGGVRLEELDTNYMLESLPGVFAAGEMLDWEAPTGGYLLTACLATGRAAALGIMKYLSGHHQSGRANQT
ncbi:MAG: TIGR03862 family flavoprotein [Rhizobiaceae bacterium]